MTAIIHRCSSCRREFRFLTAILHTYVCPACGQANAKDPAIPAPATVLRTVPEDMSLLCLGAVLKFKNVSYVVVGRYRYQLTNGYKNHWVLTSNKDDLCSLFEATGYYAFCKELEPGMNKPVQNQLRPGLKNFIAEKEYYVDGIDKAIALTCQGELPALPATGELFFIAELSNNQNDYAFVQIIDKDKVKAYTGIYGDFSDFEFSGLRKAK